MFNIVDRKEMRVGVLHTTCQSHSTGLHERVKFEDATAVPTSPFCHRFTGREEWIPSGARSTATTATPIT